MKKFESIKNTFRIMTWSWGFIRPWKKSFILCALFGMMQNAWMSVTSAYLIGQTTLHAATGDYKAMLGTVGLVGIIALVGIIVITATNYQSSKINIKGTAEIRKALFAKLNAMPAAETSRHLSGDLSTRMSMDAEGTAAFFGSMMTGDRSLFAIPVSILVSTVICIVKMPVIGLLNLVFLFVSIYLNLACIRGEYKARTERMKKASVLTQHMVDMISGSMVVRMFGLGPQKQKQYENDSAAAYSDAIRGARYNAARSSLSSAVQWGAVIFSLVAGGVMVHLGKADLGTVVFVVLMQSQINNDVLLVTNSYGRLQYAAVSAVRVKEILDQPDEQMRENIAQPDYKTDAAVEIKNLSVSYEDDTPVLKDLSLTLKNGERLAVVGGSGGGKTTLIKCLLEFVRANSGVLKLYGKPKELYSQEAVRGLMAYVPQNCYLFDATIRENIAWGNLNANEQAIQNAVDDAGLRELINGLPDGIDTRVGERGAQLSGGQRQRIAIARALVKNSPILLLDEATSALDGEAEQSIQQALERLMRGRTAVVIAHRLSTVQNADRILVMEHGEIVEEGRHEEMLKNNGRYAELYQLQYR